MKDRPPELVSVESIPLAAQKGVRWARALWDVELWREDGWERVDC